MIVAAYDDRVEVAAEFGAFSHPASWDSHQGDLEIRAGSCRDNLQRRAVLVCAEIRRLVDANLVGVLVCDLEGQILEANDAFVQMLGYTRDDVTRGLRWTELTSPEWLPACERALAQLRTAGTCEVFEKEYLHREGGRVPALVAAATIEGTPTQAVAFVLDLTERKRAEEERERLRQAQEELARISRITTMGGLTASLSHEIKQPITAAMTDAKTCLRWLAQERPDLEEVRAAAERFVAATTRAAEIINRVGSLCNQGAPQRELVDLNAIALETFALLRSEALRYGVSFRSDLAPDLPPIVADRVQLQQVLMNLMLNAIEAMQETGGQLRVTSEQGENGELLFSVSDTGVGLPPDGSHAIFEAFFTTKPQGTGMGLRISRSIIEAHGGKLWAASGSARGAIFRFSLPIKGDEQSGQARQLR